ncbi:uncharacterized protein [Asterias amurensis]|uniref:uncharacterized protein n=1 Tax=Asterias amurensis TaxID=7602 RepID=UPI003AB8041C
MNMRFITSLWICGILIMLLCETDLCLECPVQLEPQFLQPTVARLELFPENSTELICEVQRDLSSCNLDPGVEPRYGLQIWWCNSTDKSCYNSPLPEPLPPSPPFLKMDQSELKNASSLTSTLRLDNMAESRLGRYYCVAHSEDQYTTATPGYAEVFIDIQDKSPVRITNYTKIPMDPINGSPLTLSCSVVGYPTPKVTWEKNSKPIPGHENSTYFVKNVTADDAGIYVCIAQNDFYKVRSGEMTVKVKESYHGNDIAVTVVLICAAAICVVCLLVITWRFKKLWRNGQCCPTHNISIIGNNSTAIQANTVTVVHHQAPSPHRTSMHQERRSFLHLHDIFIHNHSSDVHFAELIRSNLQERESHLNIGLWSEVERPDRSSSRNKLLRLRLLNCSRIVIITSENYLKHTYHSFTSAMAKSRVSSESIRRKMIIVRVLEEDKIPRSLCQDILASLDYNVETDSCYFWPKFMKVAIPDQSELLYWA